MSASRGQLITLEGGEGAGKSTVLAALETFLHEQGVDILRTREPGGTPAGEAIRAVLLDRALTLCAQSELLLMFASRAQLVDEVVAPALAAGRLVLADRFTDASYAYQGAGRGLDPGWIAELERRVVGVRPDLTLWLDLPVETGLQRARQRGGEADRIESERVEFFERVRDGYARLAAADPARVVRIDAAQSAEQVAADAVRAIRRRWFSERTRA